MLALRSDQAGVTQPFQQAQPICFGQPLYVLRQVRNSGSCPHCGDGLAFGRTIEKSKDTHESDLGPITEALGKGRHHPARVLALFDRDVEIGDFSGAGDVVAGNLVQVRSQEIQGEGMIAEISCGCLELDIGPAHTADTQQGASGLGRNLFQVFLACCLPERSQFGHCLSRRDDTKARVLPRQLRDKRSECRVLYLAAFVVDVGLKGLHRPSSTRRVRSCRIEVCKPLALGPKVSPWPGRRRRRSLQRLSDQLIGRGDPLARAWSCRTTSCEVHAERRGSCQRSSRSSNLWTSVDLQDPSSGHSGLTALVSPACQKGLVGQGQFILPTEEFRTGRTVARSRSTFSGSDNSGSC